MSALRTALANARRDWAANRRLRMGVAVIGAILALYVFLVLQDWRAALAGQYADRTEQLYKMKSLAGQDEWLARAQAARSIRERLEAEIPEVATVGLAQAGVQGWIRDAATAFGDNVRVQTQAPAESELEGVWRIPVVISGSADPARIVQLVRRIEGRPTLSVIEEALVVNRENRTFSLTVVSYFRVREVPGDARD